MSAPLFFISMEGLTMLLCQAAKETKQWGTNAPHCFVRYLADIFFNRFGKCD